MDLNFKRPLNVFAFLLFVICILYILKLTPLTFLNIFVRGRRYPVHWFPRDFSTCSPVKNIAYLKAHKTASSAIQNILFRFGIKNNLHFALPKEDNYFGKGTYFTPNMIPIELIGNFEVNIFTIHTKWDYEQIKLIMPKDTIFIASVREPISLFESLFIYAKFQKETKLSFEEYVSSTPNNANRVDGFLGFNQMVYDFGLSETELKNVTAVKRLIDKADKYFDLVLSADKFEESLILLRHLLCWSHEDIVSFKVNERLKEYRLKKIKEEITLTLQERLSSDILLYNHFENKIEKLIDQFGEQNMLKEKEEYRKINKEIKDKCNIKIETEEDKFNVVNKPYSSMVSGFTGNLMDSYCKNFIFNELVILDNIRRKQEMEVRKALGIRGLLKYSLPKGAIAIGNLSEKSDINFMKLKVRNKIRK